MSQYFPKPYEALGGDANVKEDLSNYARKTVVKNISHVDTSSFALKSTLPSLKTKVDNLDKDKLKILPNNLSNLKNIVDKLDIDKLVLVPVDVSTLSNLVKNEVVKKIEYNATIKSIEDKIPDISKLATKLFLIQKQMKLKLKYQVFVV